MAVFFDSLAYCHYYCAPMSDRPLPEYVDTRKIFTQEGLIAGRVGLEKLDRLPANLADKQGTVTVSLQFYTDDSARRRIAGSLEAELNVICQRCLDPLHINLQDSIDLVLVHDTEAAINLDRELEPWIAEEHKLSLTSLVAEQLILAMPLVSYHEDGPCARQKCYSSKQDKAAESETEQRDNPFAVLEALKTPKKSKKSKDT